MPELAKVLRAIAGRRGSGGLYSVTDAFLLDAAGGDSNAVLLAFEHLVERGHAREKSPDGYTIELVGDAASIVVCERILVVEDDPDVRETLVELLQDHGFRPTTAKNGKEALERLRDGERPDVILFDLMMPIMDGFQLRDALKRDPDWSDIPFVVMSALADTQMVAASLGAAAGLRKPFHMKTLFQTLDGVCGRAGGSASLS
jgi:CheY-like chemotaxis protein